MWDSFTDWLNTFWTDNAGHIVATVVIIIVTSAIVRISKRALNRWEARVEADLTSTGRSADRERAQRLITITDVARIFIGIVLWSIALLTIAATWGVPMTAFLAIGSTIGIAIGFGAQDFVRDVIAGFLILVEDQYSIGDTVTIAGVQGVVEGIKLRTTVLRDLDGNQHHVPNGQIQVASNLTSEFSRLVVDIPVAYDTDLDYALDVVLNEATLMAYSEEWRSHFLEPPVMLGVNRLNDSAIDIRLLMTLTSDSRWLVKREFLKRAKQRLDAEGIVIPFNQLRVLFDQPMPDDVSPESS